jgi:hypothetical protein
LSNPESLDASSGLRHILARSSSGLGLLVDRLATPSDCEQQAAHRRDRAVTATDERVRALWTAMAQMWTKLAEEVDQLPQETGIADDAV